MFVSECEISKQACVLRLCKKDKIKAATLAKHREEEVVVWCKTEIKKDCICDYVQMGDDWVRERWGDE